MILSYKVKYKRKDGKGVQEEVVVTERFSKLKDLVGLVEYEISVAGITRKGIGPFSAKVTALTYEGGAY